MANQNLSYYINIINDFRSNRIRIRLYTGIILLYYPGNIILLKYFMKIIDYDDYCDRVKILLYIKYSKYLRPTEYVTVVFGIWSKYVQYMIYHRQI